MLGALILNDIMQQVWLMSPAYAETFKPLVLALLKGEQLDSKHDFSFERNRRLSYAVDSASLAQGGRYADFTSAPKGSIAVHSLIGPVVKRSQWCGPTGTMEIGAFIKQADQHPNISAHILIMESGGGAANAIQPINEILDSISKPLVIYAEDVLASAAYGIASHGMEIIVNHPNAIIGSIGTMMTIADWDSYFKSQGLNILNLYADASFNKNKIFSDALKGDPSGLKKQILNPWNDFFINDIKTARAGVIRSENDVIFTGETFNADEALSNHGMIDHIGNLDFAIQRATELMGGKKSVSMSTKQELNPNPENHMSILNKFPKLSALMNKEADKITAEEIDGVNAEFASRGINAVLMTESLLAEEVAAETKPLQNKIDTLTISAKTATDKLTSAVGLFQTNATPEQAIAFDLNASISKAIGKDATPAAELKSDKEKPEGEPEKDVPLSSLHR